MALVVSDPDGDERSFEFDEVLAALKHSTEGIPVYEPLVAKVADLFERARTLLVEFDEEWPEGRGKSYQEELGDVVAMVADVFRLGIRDPAELYRFCQHLNVKHELGVLI